ncbi:hypothetical protein [Natronocalculus amylovorans]|uniref:Uncharacterized protein n=1 Tax=Natronocalculus amylovorans TaxID=2917812 RepID=A0AAE3FXJ8_9EURY|nr:hypothetical protein [Natronocalculus amylovorans]MCL9817056.1 hypothetical protein [Natronocalculus amylovorans]
MRYLPPTKAFIRVFLALALVTATVGAGATPVAAQSDQPDWAVDMFGEIEPVIQTYNANVDVSKEHFVVRWSISILGGETVNLHVFDHENDTIATASFHLDNDLQMEEFELGTRDDATLHILTDKDTLEKVLTSPDPGSEFRSAYLNGDLRFSGNGMINSLKWSLVHGISWVHSAIFG